MVNDSILFNISIIVLIIGIASIVLIAVYDHNAAEETCLELKLEEDCSYEICMAEEYMSDKHQNEVNSCILEIIYKNDVLKQEGVKDG